MLVRTSPGRQRDLKSEPVCVSGETRNVLASKSSLPSNVKLSSCQRGESECPHRPATSHEAQEWCLW